MLWPCFIPPALLSSPYDRRVTFASAALLQADCNMTTDLPGLQLQNQYLVSGEAGWVAPDNCARLVMSCRIPPVIKQHRRLSDKEYRDIQNASLGSKSKTGHLAFVFFVLKTIIFSSIELHILSMP